MAAITVSPALVSRVLYVIDTARVEELLNEAIPRGTQHTRSGRPGRSSGLTWRLFLLGSILSAYVGQGHVLANIYDVLTAHIDRRAQVRLGIRHSVTGDPTFSYDSVARLSLRFAEHFDYGDHAPGDRSPADRAERRDQLLQIMDALLDATLIPAESRTFAIDGSAIWAWGRAPKAAKQGEPTKPEQADELPPRSDLPDVDDATA